MNKIPKYYPIPKRTFYFIYLFVFFAWSAIQTQSVPKPKKSVFQNQKNYFIHIILIFIN